MVLVTNVSHVCKKHEMCYYGNYTHKFLCRRRMYSTTETLALRFAKRSDYSIYTWIVNHMWMHVHVLAIFLQTAAIPVFKTANPTQKQNSKFLNTKTTSSLDKSSHRQVM